MVENKTLKLVIEGDSLNAVEAFRQVTNAVSYSNAAIIGLNSTFDTLESRWTHAVTIASGKTSELKKAAKTLSEAFNEGAIKSSKISESKVDTKNIIADLREKNKQQLFEIQQTLELEKTIRANGIDSIKTILKKAAQDEINIKRELNSKLSLLEDQFLSGEITKRQAASKAKYAIAVAGRTIGGIQQGAAEAANIPKTFAEPIDFSGRKAAIEAEVAWENATYSKHYNAEVIARADFARKKLVIDQQYAANKRKIEGELKLGIITNVEAEKQATDALNSYAKALRGLPNLADTIAQHRSLFSTIALSTAIYRVTSSALNTLWEGMKAIPKVGIEMEATFASLSSTMEQGFIGAASAMKGINEEAQRTGLNINALRESFRNFQASTSLAGESLENTWQMFTNINTVSTALHLSVDKTNAVFNALAQIFNKGKVQSEELVKQLGNLLPGAFAAFAKANKKTTDQLAKEMELGLVKPKDTILKFTEFLKNEFATAANVAAIGFNAEIGRMQNSFITLGEAIYGTTKGPMIEFVRGVTSITNYLAEGIKGTNEFTNTLKLLENVLYGIAAGATVQFIASFYKMATGLQATAGAAGLLVKTLEFFGSPAGIVTGIVAIGAAIYDNLKSPVETANKSLQEYLATYDKINAERAKAKELGISEPAAREYSIALQQADEAKKLLENQQNIVSAKRAELSAKDLREYEQSSNKASRAKTEILAGSMALPFNAQQRQLFEEEEKLKNIKRDAARARQIVDKQIADNAEIQANKLAETEFNASSERSRKQTELKIKRLKREGDLVGAARLQQELQFGAEKKAAEAKIAEIESITTDKRTDKQKQDLEIAKETLADYAYEYAHAGEKLSNTQKANNKQFQANLIENTGAIKIHAEESKSAIEQLDSLYKRHGVTIEDYANKRRAIIEESYAKEIASLEKNRQLAISHGDVAKAEKYRTEIETARVAKAGDLKAVDDQQLERNKSLVDSIEIINAEYDKLMGKEEEILKFRKIREALQGEKQTPEVTGALTKLDLLERTKAATDNVSKIENELTLTRDSANEKLQRVNILRQSGAISEISAMRQISSIYEEQIKLTEEKIALEEKELALAPDNEQTKRLKLNLEKQRTYLAELKLNAEQVGNLVQKSLGDAFENSFASLINGTATAKQAFGSFASSVINDINKIIANEIRSSILQPILKKGIGFLGGLIGSAFGGGAGAGTTQITSSLSLGSLGSAAGFANGGIASGISSASGTILSSPTYFPNAKPTMLASGGVIAGEAGAEAVLPLKRLKSGKLGVISEGNASNIKQDFNITVNVTKNDGENDIAFATKVAETISRQIAKEEIMKASRLGNINNRLNKIA